ncbi:hypothetical protein [Cellulomonas sp.]|uniref:hypothetical protein n=1 Tax=Cellulomonas sp. TaxID=40001 RepID=UPI003BAD813E
MSNPYAPPDADRQDAPAPQDGPSWPPPMPRPQAPAAPERQPPDPEVAAHATRLTRLFGVLVLGSVLVATLPLPWQAAGLLFAVAALVVGIRGLIIAGRARTRGLVPLLAVGIVIALSWTLILGVQLALWPVQQDKQECLEGALTISATNACETQYEKDLDDLRTSLENPGS